LRAARNLLRLTFESFHCPLSISYHSILPDYAKLFGNPKTSATKHAGGWRYLQIHARAREFNSSNLLFPGHFAMITAIDGHCGCGRLFF